MKKIIAILMVLALMFSLTACGNTGTTSGAGATKLTVGTGGTSGTYYAYGGVLGNHIKANTGITINVVSTDGSKANLLGMEKGNYQLGTVQSDVIAYAWEGTRLFESKIDSFRVIGGLYAETVQLVTMDPAIKTVADLRGKKVSIGAAGSGVYFNALDVLAAAGLSEDDIVAQRQSFGDSADALKDGKIDAAFIVAGAPTPAIQELSASKDIYIVPIDGAVASKLMEGDSFYTEYKIPANTYKGQTAEVLTVAVKATLVVNASVSEDDVYKITKAIFDNPSAISHAKAAELSLENATQGMAVPFHAGAAKYFAEKNITVNTK